MTTCSMMHVASAEVPLPKIAVFSGPTATIQNAYPLITGNKARHQHGLPLLNGPDGRPLAFDRLYAQRLAAPVTVYIEAFSAHPLESDAAELYAPPDGYLDRDGRFREQRTGPDDRPVYAVELRPEDGLYPLPYVARQRDGKAWDAAGAFPGAPFEQTRQTFYPDGSRIFEEIERSGGSLYGKAEYHFYRPAPSGGYTKGLPAGRRTDHGTGDVPPERLGRDFFRYGEHRADAPRGRLAVATRIVQEAMAGGEYAGGIWLEGSPNVEESAYWLNLLIDTTRPIVCHSAQRARGYLSADGDRNIVDGVQYILSGLWADERGRDRLGGVLIVDQVVFSAREVQKGDARPGGYVATGGFGGVLGSVGYDTTITFLPNRLHTHRSEVRISALPETVTGVRRDGTRIATRAVRVKDTAGNLVPESIPNVSIVKASRWRDPDPFANGDDEVEVLSRIEANLRGEALAGFVQEGVTGGGLTMPVQAALERAVFSGFPLVKVNRGNPEGFMRRNANDLYIEGGNLTATKARLLLMASLLKLGALPPAVDPMRPTEAERRAILGRIAEYQRIFDTH
ncbi:MAG: asparaginase [Verrucomicrobiae bacterium]|nr:asparaginase [Verrucomicrobiae bacterium]